MGVTHFWYDISDISLNERQVKVVKKLLEAGIDGFIGGLAAKKHQRMVEGSRATLTQDLANLVNKRVLVITGERQVSRYALA